MMTGTFTLVLAFSIFIVLAMLTIFSNMLRIGDPLNGFVHCDWWLFIEARFEFSVTTVSSRLEKIQHFSFYLKHYNVDSYLFK